MFDRSFLPPVDTEFVVIADTHYMIDPGDRPLEFESRRKQTHRSRAAMEAVHALGADEVIHMGDLVQEYPETPDYPQALDEALKQIDGIGLRLRHCAGNHDVGDKPDPSMPTHPVTPKGLAHYSDRVGKSFYSFDSGTYHFVVLNSQLLNTALPEAEEQVAWLENDLKASSGRRIALFLHLPPYLLNADDPAFGNYDVIADPARSWLLDLIGNHRIELVVAAHVHFAFFDRMGESDYYIMPSPAFTRPGFSHLFNSPPPPEHGRDDTPKLAFYLFRSGEDFLDLHVVRTSGNTEWGTGSRVLTRTARSLPTARLGMTLTHTPTPTGQVPLAYPSIVRQTVRNDYPILTCQEMGLKHVRVPVSDLLDETQNGRLQILRSRGVNVTAMAGVRNSDELAEIQNEIGDRADSVELQIAKADLGQIGPPSSSLPLAIAQVDPSEKVTGKQHLRTRVGFRIADASYSHPFDRTVVSVAAWESPMELGVLASAPPTKPIDISLDLVDDDSDNVLRVAQASLLTACIQGARLFCQPYLDLDRTMDVANGFLDGLCNPREVVNVYRLLNTILFHADEEWTLVSTDPLSIRSTTRELQLNSAGSGTHYDLAAGTREPEGVAGQVGLLEITL